MKSERAFLHEINLTIDYIQTVLCKDENMMGCLYDLMTEKKHSLIKKIAGIHDNVVKQQFTKKMMDQYEVEVAPVWDYVEKKFVFVSSLLVILNNILDASAIRDFFYLSLDELQALVNSSLSSDEFSKKQILQFEDLQSRANSLQFVLHKGFLGLGTPQVEWINGGKDYIYVDTIISDAIYGKDWIKAIDCNINNLLNDVEQILNSQIDREMFNNGYESLIKNKKQPIFRIEEKDQIKKKHKKKKKANLSPLLSLLPLSPASHLSSSSSTLFVLQEQYDENYIKLLDLLYSMNDGISKIQEMAVSVLGDILPSIIAGYSLDLIEQKQIIANNIEKHKNIEMMSLTESKIRHCIYEMQADIMMLEKNIKMVNEWIEKISLMKATTEKISNIGYFWKKSHKKNIINGTIKKLNLGANSEIREQIAKAEIKTALLSTYTLCAKKISKKLGLNFELASVTSCSELVELLDFPFYTSLEDMSQLFDSLKEKMVVWEEEHDNQGQIKEKYDAFVEPFLDAHLNKHYELYMLAKKSFDVLDKINILEQDVFSKKIKSDLLEWKKCHGSMILNCQEYCEQMVFSYQTEVRDLALKLKVQMETILTAKRFDSNDERDLGNSIKKIKTFIDMNTRDLREDIGIKDCLIDKFVASLDLPCVTKNNIDKWQEVLCLELVAKLSTGALRRRY